MDWMEAVRLVSLKIFNFFEARWIKLHIRSFIERIFIPEHFLRFFIRWSLTLRL